jgi:hypothetical protein
MEELGLLNGTARSFGYEDFDAWEVQDPWARFKVDLRRVNPTPPMERMPRDAIGVASVDELYTNWAEVQCNDCRRPIREVQRGWQCWRYLGCYPGWDWRTVRVGRNWWRIHCIECGDCGEDTTAATEQLKEDPERAGAAEPDEEHAALLHALGSDIEPRNSPALVLLMAP